MIFLSFEKYFLPENKKAAIFFWKNIWVTEFMKLMDEKLEIF